MAFQSDIYKGQGNQLFYQPSVGASPIAISSPAELQTLAQQGKVQGYQDPSTYKSMANLPGSQPQQPSPSNLPPPTIPATVPPAPTTQNPPATGVTGNLGGNTTGATNSGFNQIFGNIVNKAKETQVLIDQKNKLVTHMFDHSLTPQEMQGLSPSAQAVLQSGDPALVGYAVSMLNDQIKGRADDNMTSLSYAYSGYQQDQAEIAAKQTQMQTMQKDAYDKFTTMIDKYPDIAAQMSPEGLQALSEGRMPPQADIGAAYKAYSTSLAGMKLGASGDKWTRIGSTLGPDGITVVPQYGWVNAQGQTVSGNSVSPTPDIQDPTGSTPQGNQQNVPAGANPSKVLTSGGQTYDFSTYATDPAWGTSVKGILDNMGQFQSLDDVSSYIKQNAPNSKITADMISKASQQYGVPWEMITAIMQHESGFGTLGKGAYTNNPGNVGNTDSGAIIKMSSWQDGVNAVAKQIAKRSVSGASSTPTSAQSGTPTYNGKLPPGLTQGGLLMAAQQYLKTGTLPSLGQGKVSGATKEAVINYAAQLTAGTSGGDVAANKTELKSLSGSLDTQQKYLDTTQRSVENADKSFQQLITTFKDKGLNPYDSQVANKWLNDYKKNFTKTDLFAYNAGLTEVANEYTQVFSRGGTVSDAVRSRANDVANGDISFTDLQKVMDELQAQGQIVIQGSKNQIDQIQGQIRGIGGIGNGSSSNSSSVTITVTSPDGTVGTIPKNQLQEALAAGYKQQ